MWDINEKRSLAKDIWKIPKQVLAYYELWKKIVEHDGPEGLRKIKGFHDESLKGEWKGYRSSRLNLKWRVIYKIDHDICEAYVIDINAHDYNRR